MEFGGHHVSQYDSRTLWMGDLPWWMDEAYMTTLFASYGEHVQAKVIRSKVTGQPEGYGFLEFSSHDSAERVLLTYNGTVIPNTDLHFRLNWASFGINERRPANQEEYSLFVGDLSQEVTDQLLLETFQPLYPSAKAAKVVMDPMTGRPKGYGFVRFLDEVERDRAVTEMQGQYCGSKPMRINVATPRQNQRGGALQGHQAPPAAAPSPPVGAHGFANYGVYNTGAGVQAAAVTTQSGLPPEADPSNTTVFVGGLDPMVTEDQLRYYFAPYGELAYVRIPAGKGCGFVHFKERVSAEAAMAALHGFVIGSHPIRLSWGKSVGTRRANRMDVAAGPSPPSYGGYYGAAADPSLTAATAYGGGSALTATTGGVPAYGGPSAGLGNHLGGAPSYAAGVAYSYGPAPSLSQEASTGTMPGAAAAAMAVAQKREEENLVGLSDVDALNAAFISLLEPSLLGRYQWLHAAEALEPSLRVF